MNQQAKNKNLLKISLPLFAYVIYLLFLSTTDILSLGLFYIGHTEFNIIASIIALVTTIFIMLFIIKKTEITQYHLDFLAYFFIVMIFICGFIRGIIPDLSYDVQNGRVFWQYPGFQDNINYNAFPAGFTFFFPLPDRIFYYPRMILGYRLGMLTNTMFLLLCFFETRALIGDLLGSQLTAVKNKLTTQCSKNIQYSFVLLFFNESSLALIANILFYTVTDLGTYMVDIVAIPLLLYMLRILLKKEHDTDIFQFIFFSMLCGLCFALKLTNLILIAPILFLYLIKNRKHITVPYFLTCCIIGILPAAPYLIYSYTSTGNPVYWTYNAIFKSPYAIDTNFKDTRWGPENLKDFLLWPLRLIFNPTERVSEISKYPQIYIFIGIFSSVTIIYKTLRKKITDIRFMTLSLVFFMMYLLWLSSTGYPRYAIICEIISVILFGIIMAHSLISEERILRLISYICLFCLVIQLGGNYIIGINNVCDWGWRGTTIANGKNGKIHENAKWFLYDRGRIGTKEQQEKIGCFLSMSNTHLMMKFLNPSAPIINASYIISYFPQLKDIKGIDYVDYYKDKVDYFCNEGKAAFDIALLNELSSVCEVANQWGVEIVDAEYIDNYFDKDTIPLLIQYEKSERNNCFENISNYPVNIISPSEGNPKMNGIIFVHPNIQDNSQIQIVSYRQGQEKIIADFELHPGEFIDLSEKVLLSSISSEEEVFINVVNGNPYTYVINAWIE